VQIVDALNDSHEAPRIEGLSETQKDFSDVELWLSQLPYKGVARRRQSILQKLDHDNPMPAETSEDPQVSEPLVEPHNESSAFIEAFAKRKGTWIGGFPSPAAACVAILGLSLVFGVGCHVLAEAVDKSSSEEPLEVSHMVKVISPIGFSPDALCPEMVSIKSEVWRIRRTVEFLQRPGSSCSICRESGQTSLTAIVKHSEGESRVGLNFVDLEGVLKHIGGIVFTPGAEPPVRIVDPFNENFGHIEATSSGMWNFVIGSATLMTISLDAPSRILMLRGKGNRYMGVVSRRTEQSSEVLTINVQAGCDSSLVLSCVLGVLLMGSSASPRGSPDTPRSDDDLPRPLRMPGDRPGPPQTPPPTPRGPSKSSTLSHGTAASF